MKLQGLILLSVLLTAFSCCMATPANDATKTTNTAQGQTCTQRINSCISLLNQNQNCPLLPVLPKSLVVPPAPGTYRLTELRKGVFSYEDGAYISLILKQNRNVAIIDFPDSANSFLPNGTYLLIEALKEVLGDTTIGRMNFVYSHSHFDHIGGAQRVFDWVKQNYNPFDFQIFGTKETLNVIQQSTSMRAPEPTHIVHKYGAKISLGVGLNVLMTEVGGHTLTDLLIEIPKYNDQKGVVMFVDLVFPKWTAPYNLALTVDINLFVNAHNELLKRDYQVFVPGHIQLGTKQDVRISLEYTRDLLAKAALALKSVTTTNLVQAGIGKIADPKATEFGNVWYAVIQIQRKLEIDACYKMMLKDWGCRLSGLDLTLRDHCQEAITYTVVDI